MRRLHLFEFGDLNWFPQVLRDGETGYLAAAYRMYRTLPRLWADKIATVLDSGQPAEIVDLCAGSGGAVPQIIDELIKRNFDVHVNLADLYPHPKSGSHPRMVWLTEPVDARRVPPSLMGVRTMFSAFHHFRPEDASAILKDAFELRRTICIFESGSGGLLGIAAVIGVPVVVLGVMPFARPFRWPNLVFTYLIPLLPLIILWDAIVSMLRIYSPEQMKDLTGSFVARDYAWEIGRIRARGIPGGLPYLIGHRDSASTAGCSPIPRANG